MRVPHRWKAQLPDWWQCDWCGATVWSRGAPPFMQDHRLMAHHSDQSIRCDCFSPKFYITHEVASVLPDCNENLLFGIYES